MFHRILIALDGSEDAHRGLHEAIDLARLGKAQLTVLSVCPKPVSLLIGGPVVPPIDIGALDDAIKEEHQRLLDDALSEVPDDVSVVRVLAQGSPAREILEQAEKGNHDLVVMGSRGRGGTSAMVLGSVSHQVLHRSPVPVLVTHDGAPHARAA
jgi:nucleotide-binding universal stress UspA family protein